MISRSCELSGHRDFIAVKTGSRIDSPWMRRTSPSSFGCGVGHVGRCELFPEGGHCQTPHQAHGDGFLLYRLVPSVDLVRLEVKNPLEIQ
jgi:hypothetical protein